jgi:hypothetical protein
VDSGIANTRICRSCSSPTSDLEMW